MERLSEPSIIDLPRIQDPRGNLSFIQGGQCIPFEIARCYWIYDVPGGMVRHGRALQSTVEMIVAVSGSFDVTLDLGHGDPVRFHLCRGYMGLIVPEMTWREIDNFSTNSVAMVLASTTYDENDYIRDYRQFRHEKESSDQ